MFVLLCYTESMATPQPSAHYKQLKNKWVKKHRDAQKNFWDKHGEHINTFFDKPRRVAVGSMAGLLMLAQPVPSALLAQNITTPDLQQQPIEQSPEDKRKNLVQDLQPFLPEQVDPLTPEQENQIADMLTDTFGIKASPSYEGKRLNRTYGYIGAEQHLMRYPGDTMASHFDNPDDANKYYSSGMAPGRGAWGYFAHSREGMTEKDVQREKWYIAVPTFLSPTWHNDVNMHYKFFKYRKMLVVNPENGKAVVADIGDAGPAQWTGKHLGGSPEVMKHLERVDGRAKGPVLYFFIRDPQDERPLGPINVQ